MERKTMLQLDEIKQMKEQRAKCNLFTPEDVPLGMQVISEDFNSKATIMSVAGDKVYMSGPVLIEGKEVLCVTLQDFFDNWLLIMPDGKIAVCGIPEDSGIITPSSKEFTLT